MPCCGRAAAVLAWALLCLSQSVCLFKWGVLLVLSNDALELGLCGGTALEEHIVRHASWEHETSDWEWRWCVCLERVSTMPGFTH